MSAGFQRWLGFDHFSHPWILLSLDGTHRGTFLLHGKLYEYGSTQYWSRARFLIFVVLNPELKCICNQKRRLPTFVFWFKLNQNAKVACWDFFSIFLLNNIHCELLHPRIPVTPPSCDCMRILLFSLDRWINFCCHGSYHVSPAVFSNPFLNLTFERNDQILLLFFQLLVLNDDEKLRRDANYLNFFGRSWNNWLLSFRRLVLKEIKNVLLP